MIIGYARVSSVGQSLDEQLEALNKCGCDLIYSEKRSGKSVDDRVEFQKAVEAVHSGDTLVVTKLDRLARNTAEGIAVIEELIGRNVSVDILNMGRIDDTAIGKLTWTVLLAFAEFERNMIHERCYGGYVRARENGVRVGRPRKTVGKRDDGETVSEACKRLGVSRSTYYRSVGND